MSSRRLTLRPCWCYFGHRPSSPGKRRMAATRHPPSKPKSNGWTSLRQLAATPVPNRRQGDAHDSEGPGTLRGAAIKPDEFPVNWVVSERHYYAPAFRGFGRVLLCFGFAVLVAAGADFFLAEVESGAG